jgi:Uma2 family endonuclease
MPISEETYERVALEDSDGKWELHCGRLRSKPGMTARHNYIGDRLAFRLQQQLPLDQYRVSGDRAHVRISETRTYIPDVAVIPIPLVERMEREQPTQLEVHREPLPLVVEVWSPSTGTEDLTEKLPGYQQRGDAEIWLLRAQERTLRAYVRQPDGTYIEHVYHGGLVRPAALPNVAIDLDELFAL